MSVLILLFSTTTAFAAAPTTRVTSATRNDINDPRNRTVTVVVSVDTHGGTIPGFFQIWYRRDGGAWVNAGSGGSPALINLPNNGTYSFCSIGYYDDGGNDYEVKTKTAEATLTVDFNIYPTSSPTTKVAPPTSKVPTVRATQKVSGSVVSTTIAASPTPTTITTNTDNVQITSLVSLTKTINTDNSASSTQQGQNDQNNLGSTLGIAGVISVVSGGALIWFLRHNRMKANIEVPKSDAL
jgi:hypothetical protein